MKRHAIVIGTQWGDEGKGKVVDAIVKDFDVVVRYQGGSNAGHTVVADGQTHKLHLLPSGILHANKKCLIADGVIVDPEILLEELGSLEKSGVKRSALYLGNRVNLIMPWHKLRDGIAGGAIGTTKKGIGPTYTDLVNRRGIRVHDWVNSEVFSQRVAEEVKWNRLLVEAMAKEYELPAKEIDLVTSDEAFNATAVSEQYRRYYEKLVEYGVEVVDVPIFLEELHNNGERFLFEGAQGSMLDIVYGNYPFVTSSHVGHGGLIAGTGFVPDELEVIGVMKAYTTRVGNGPFPTELNNDVGVKLREKGNEYGATTGRPRRCGWLDLEVVKHAIRVNGVTQLYLSKLDVLAGMEHVDVGVAYMLNGEVAPGVPASQLEHAKCVPVYESMDGFAEDISSVSSFDNLPENARQYVKYLEDFLRVPVKWVGVGPGREAMIEV